MSVDFGGGTLTSAGGKDVFLARVDSMGNALWSRGFGDSAEQVGTSLAGGSDGSVVMTGYFSGVLDFGVGPLTSQGGVGTFLTKFSE